MAVQYSIMDDLLTLELVGIYESRDVVRQFLDALNDPKCPASVGLLVDVSGSESLATRPVGEIRMVAEFLGPYADRIGGRCAMVAPKDVQFGLSQLGSSPVERVGIAAQVFRTKEAAVEWLRSSALPR